MLIGGMAAVQHGATYVTSDVDICVPLRAENFRRIEQAVTGLGPRFRNRRDLPFALTEEMLAGLKNLYLQTVLGPLDCLGEVQGVGDYDAVLAQSERTAFPYGEINILKIEPLIRAKASIGRPQDKLVVTQLEAIQERLKQTKSN